MNIDEKSMFIWRNINSLSWGMTDLVFRDDVNFYRLKIQGEWTSEIENNFTTNRETVNLDKKSFLAGAYKFKPDIIEIYGLKPVE